MRENESVKWLYDNLTEEGYNVGKDYAEFDSLIVNNDESRKWVYDTATSLGYNVGKDYNEFSSLVLPAQQPKGGENGYTRTGEELGLKEEAVEEPKTSRVRQMWESRKNDDDVEEDDDSEAIIKPLTPKQVDKVAQQVRAEVGVTPDVKKNATPNLEYGREVADINAPTAKKVQDAMPAAQETLSQQLAKGMTTAAAHDRFLQQGRENSVQVLGRGVTSGLMSDYSKKRTGRKEQVEKDVKRNADVTRVAANPYSYSADPYNQVAFKSGATKLRNADDLGMIEEFAKDAKNRILTDETLKAEVQKEADLLEMSLEDYVDKIAVPALQQRMYEEWIAPQEEKAKENYNGVMAAVEGSLIGMLLGSTRTETEKYLSQVGQEAWRQDASLLDRALSGAGSMFLDLPIFGGFGSLASVPTKYVGGQVFKHLAKNEAKKVIARGASEAAAQRYANYAVTNGLKNRILLNLSTSPLQSGLTFGMFDAGKAALSMSLNGEWDWSELGKSAGGGFLLGAALGGTNAVGGGVTAGLTGGVKTAAKIAEFGVENAVFTEGGRLIGKLHGQQPENGWWEDYLESGATLLMLKAPNIVKNVSAIKGDKEASEVFAFNELEREQLGKYGEELNAVLESLLPQSKRVFEDGLKISEGTFTEEYRRVMSDPEVSMTTKAKLMGIVEGKVMPAPRVVDAQIEGNRVMTYDPMGRLVEVKEYATEAKANAEYKKVANAAEIESIAVMEDMYMRIKGYEADDVTVREWLAKNPTVTAEDIANIIAKNSTGEKLTEGEQRILESLRKARREGLNDVRHLNDVLAELDVDPNDVMSGIEKPIDERTEAENRAVKAYTDVLYQEIKAKVGDVLERGKARRAEDINTTVRLIESDRSVDETANDGMVYTTTTPSGEKVIITGGKVVLDNEGYIDVNQSEGLVAMYPDGSRKPIRPGDLREKVEVANAEEIKAVKREEIANEQADVIVTDSEWWEALPTDNGEVKTESGKPMTEPMADASQNGKLVPGAEIEIAFDGEVYKLKVEGRDERGDIILSGEGASMAVPESAVLEGMKEAERFRNGEVKGENQIEVAPVATTATTEMQTAPVTQAETVQPQVVAPKVAEVTDFFRMDGKNYAVVSRNEDGSVTVAVDGKRAVLPAETNFTAAVPTDKGGKVLFTEMPAEKTLEYFVQRVPNSQARAQMIENNRKQAESALKKYDKEPNVGTDPDAYEATMNKWEADKKAAQAKVDYWNEVAKRDAKISQSEMRESVEAVKPREVIEMTPDEFVANQLGGIKITPESFQKETGTKAEQKQMVGVIAGKEKGGVSIERAAEIIYESYGDELRGLGFNGDMQDVRDMIIDVLSNGNPRSFARKGLEMRQQTDVEQQLAELRGVANALNFESIEEQIAYEESIMPRIMQELKGFDETEYFNNLAENYENDTTRESENTRGSSELLQGEQSADNAGTGNIAEPGQGGEVQGDVYSGGENAAPQGNQQVNGSEIPNGSTISQASEQVIDHYTLNSAGNSTQMLKDMEAVRKSNREEYGKITPAYELFYKAKERGLYPNELEELRAIVKGTSLEGKVDGWFTPVMAEGGNAPGKSGVDVIQEPRSVEEVLENGDKRITNYNSRGEVATVATERDGKVVSVDSYDEGVLFEHTEYDTNGVSTSVTRYNKQGNVIGTTQSAKVQENAKKSGEDELDIYLAEMKAAQERQKAFAQKSPRPSSFVEAYTANDAEVIKRLDKQFNDALQTLVPLDIPAIEATIRGMKDRKSTIKAGSVNGRKETPAYKAFDHIEKALAKRKKQLEKELTEDDKRRIDIIKRGDRGELKETPQPKQENKPVESEPIKDETPVTSETAEQPETGEFADAGPVSRETLQLNMSEEDFNALLNSGDKAAISEYLAEMDGLLRIGAGSPLDGRDTIVKEYRGIVEQYGGEENIPADVVAGFDERIAPYNALQRAVFDRKYALQDKLREIEANEAQAKEQAEKEAKAEHKKTAFGGFLAGKTDLGASAAEKALNKKYNFDGKVMTVAEFVEEAVANGNAKLLTIEEPKYKGASRAAWNRMDARQQEADAKRVKESGTKTVYTVNDHDLGKTAYDYAKFLLDKKAEQEKAAAKQKVKDAIEKIMSAVRGGEYQKRSARLGDYWASDKELAARALQDYMMRKLDERGQKNDFLSNHLAPEDWAGDMNNYPFPLGAEADRIAEAFDNFFATVEEKTEDGQTVLFQQGMIEFDRENPAFERATKVTMDAVERLKENGLDIEVVSQEEADAMMELAEMQNAEMQTSKEIEAKYPDWLEGTTTESGKHSTQVEGTRKTYKKIGDWIEENLGMDVAILDASSGMGYGTADLRERGFNIEDVEPYQSEDRKQNNPATYSSYADIDKQYDYIISNAVLNVIPDDWRTDVLHNMADKLKDGGKLFINTRKAGEERSIKDKIELDSPQEVLVKRNGRIASYQRFFTPQELKGWIESELGNGYTVEIANKANSGTNGLAAVVVTKNNESPANGKTSELGQPILKKKNAPLANVAAKVSKNAERASRLDAIISSIEKIGEMGPHEFLHEIVNAMLLSQDISTEKSRYAKLGGGVTMRLANHYGNAETFKEHKDQTENYGLVIKLSNNPFKPDKDVDYLEYVYFPDKLTKERQIEIAKGLKAFMETGRYDLLPKPDKVNPSGKFVGRTELSTTDGKVYGWAVDGKIRLTPDGINPNTPVHEYVHLWGADVEKNNPKLWKEVVEAMKLSPVWNEVANDANYSNIHGNDSRMASEVLARLSGRENYRRTMEEAEKEIAADRDIVGKVQKKGILNRIKNALKNFWNWVQRNVFRSGKRKGESGQRSTEVMPWEEFANSVVGDFYKGKNPNVKESPLEKMLMGEKGAENLDKAEEATTRLDNLNVAREMESAGKDAKAIKLATGWERGADGKWRYETEDVKLNRAAELFSLENHESYPIAESLDKGRVDFNGTIKLADLVNDEELFKAYPGMEKYFVSFEEMSANVKGEHDAENTMIRINKDDISELESTLVHEIQHAIQSAEGFAMGGSTETIDVIKDKARVWAWRNALKETEKEHPELAGTTELEKVLMDEYRTEGLEEYIPTEEQRIKGFNLYARGYDGEGYERAFYAMPNVVAGNGFATYRRLAGEVESRNVQERMGMSPEERRNRLAEETEDVSREDQIFMYDNLGVSASQEVAPEQDAEYMTAVENGDMETAERLVKEAAKLAMPDTNRVDRDGNPIGDGSWHMNYKVDEVALSYPNISYKVDESASTESVYITYTNNDPKYPENERPKVTVRYSNHDSNAVKFGDQLRGEAVERNNGELLYRLGLKERAWIPAPSVPTQTVSKKDLENGTYEESELTERDIMLLPVGADIAEHKGKLIKGTNKLILVDKVLAGNNRGYYRYSDIPEVEQQRTKQLVREIVEPFAKEKREEQEGETLFSKKKLTPEQKAKQEALKENAKAIRRLHNVTSRYPITALRNLGFALETQEQRDMHDRLFAERDAITGESMPAGLQTNPQAMTLQERITESLLKHAEQEKENVEMRLSAIRAYGRDLANVIKLMNAQKGYDKRTVRIFTDLVKMYLRNNAMSGMSSYKIIRLLNLMQKATGGHAKTVNGAAVKIAEIITNEHTSQLEAIMEKQMKTGAERVNASGVVVQGGVDIIGKRILNTYKDAINLDDKGFEEKYNDSFKRVGEIQKQLEENGSNTALENQLKEAQAEADAMLLAATYRNEVKAAEADITKIKDELTGKRTKAEKGEITWKEYHEFAKTINSQIVQLRAQQIDAYQKVLHALSGDIYEGVQRARAFREAEAMRVQRIHDMAESDMNGVDKSAERKEPGAAGKTVDMVVYKNPIVRTVMNGLGTYENYMKYFGCDHLDGRGELFNHFMTAFTEAQNKEWKESQNDFNILEAAAQEIFGKKRIGKTYKSIARESTKPSGVILKYWNGGATVERELTIGQLMYLYMTEKQAEGQMKLRNMGLTEEKVQGAVEQLPTKYKKFADYIQAEFLPQMRPRMNEVHQRMFGASMSEVENYFPLKVNQDARKGDTDLNNTADTIPSTITGSVIKRRVNVTPIDLMANAFDVLNEHIVDMEHWAAYAEFIRDNNTLINDKDFKNRVQNTKSVRYGDGKTVWNNFVDTARIATGNYKSKADYLAKLMSGANAAKITFGYYTALKQLSSLPAFLADANAIDLVWNTAKAYGSWQWAIKNLPGFEERWKGRTAGNERLGENEYSIHDSRIMKFARMAGMTPNAFIDAAVVAAGARAVYETRLRFYKSLGLTNYEADKRAKNDAAISYNETQQSGQGAYLSTLQKDGGLVALLTTLFRNSQMAFQRRVVGSMVEVGKKLARGEKIREATKQKYIKMGMSEEAAGKQANRDFCKAYAKDITNLAIFGYAMNYVWALMGELPYLLLGDDEEEKEKIFDTAAKMGITGTFEGFTCGNFAKSLYEKHITDGKYAVGLLEAPFEGDLQVVFERFEKDGTIAGVLQLAMFATEMNTGISPQRLIDTVTAFIYYSNGDIDKATRAQLFALRLLKAPQSQQDKLILDETDGADVEEVKSIAEWYIKYKMARNFPLGSEDEKRVDKYANKFVETLKERVEKDYNPEDISVIYDQSSDTEKEILKKKWIEGMDERNGTNVAKSLRKEKLEELLGSPVENAATKALHKYSKVNTYEKLETFEDLERWYEYKVLHDKFKSDYEKIRDGEELSPEERAKAVEHYGVYADKGFKEVINAIGAHKKFIKQNKDPEWRMSEVRRLTDIATEIMKRYE